MTIQWQKTYSVQIAEIDQQHQQLVKIINQLYAAINTQCKHQELDLIIKELINYTEYHFTTEEKYFTQCHFANQDQHTNEHQQFKKKILEFYNQFQNTQGQNQDLELAFVLIDYLEDWFIEHLQTMDQEYVSCFHSCGLK